MQTAEAKCECCSKDAEIVRVDQEDGTIVGVFCTECWDAPQAVLDDGEPAPF